jgi:hypothetical protein
VKVRCIRFRKGIEAQTHWRTRRAAWPDFNFCTPEPSADSIDEMETAMSDVIRRAPVIQRGGVRYARAAWAHRMVHD